MDDTEIIERFWARSESAIAALRDKYYIYCRSIASNILGNAEDAEEVINIIAYGTPCPRRVRTACGRSLEE